MTQITTGIRRILSMASAYDAFQNLVGAKHVRATLCAKYICAQSGETLLDVGCGTARILEFLPADIRYFGFDLSQKYIDSARAAYGKYATFYVGDVASKNLEVPDCDVVIATGILHHLDDSAVDWLLQSLHQRLVSGGRLITIDPAYWPRQSMLAKMIISRDRGQNVRNGDGYRRLAARHFSEVELVRRDDLLRMPYSHAILKCIK